MARGGMTAKRPIALTIAGSDSGGGAGVQADIKTFAALGIHGASAIAAITAQNTLGVSLVEPTRPAVLRDQIDAVLADFDVAAIKVGMLASAANARVVAGALLSDALKRSHDGRPMRAPFLVLDPVLAATTGDALSGAGLLEALREKLFARVDLLTPNLAEAATLLDCAEARDEAEMIAQGEALRALGPLAVLMKGGHLPGAEAVDWLIARDGRRRYAGPRIVSANTHGTGCTLSSAIAAYVVRGADLGEAVSQAKEFVAAAILAGRDVTLGAGAGPVLPMALR